MMTTTQALQTIPQFCRGQRVAFVGGAGTVRNHRLEAGSWTYLIEMEMGPEPEVGRIGSETTVMLPENDITTNN
jgi:hypothetical protein